MEHIYEAVVAVLGGATIVQLAPIKIEPWTWLARRIGRAINGEVLDKVSEMEKRLAEMEEQDKVREAKNIRFRILRFGDECRHKVWHSKEHFDQIIEDIDHYETYCAEHPDFKNNKAATVIYSVIAIAFLFLGTLASNNLVWELTDFFNYLMVIPNVIALIALYKVVVKNATAKKDKVNK